MLVLQHPVFRTPMERNSAGGGAVTNGLTDEAIAAFANDPDDCGVEASWNHMCLSCHRRMEKALTERASSVLQ